MLSLVGIGGAGSKIVDAFYRKDPFTNIVSKISQSKREIAGVAIDTSDTLESLKNIPRENKVVIGKSTAKGHGTGGNVELGRKIMEEELELALNTIRKVNRQKPDMFLLFSGLGGGTGTGGAGILSEVLRKYYDVEVVGVFILPSRAEGAHYIKNAYSDFNRLRSGVSGVLLQDNNVLANRGEDISTSRKIITRSVVKFFEIAQPQEVSSVISGKVCGFGSMRVKETSISAKDAIEQLLREHVHVDIGEKSPEKFLLIVRGSPQSFYGEGYAQQWVKNRYGAELDIRRKPSSGSKHADIALVVVGLGSLLEREKDTGVEEERSIPSELEDLLGDIQSL